MMSDNSAKCLVCERDSNQIPLMAFQYRLATVWICPEHLPILIHQPGRLADRLAGADGFSGAQPDSDE